MSKFRYELLSNPVYHAGYEHAAFEIRQLPGAQKRAFIQPSDALQRQFEKDWEIFMAGWSSAMRLNLAHG